LRTNIYKIKGWDTQNKNNYSVFIGITKNFLNFFENFPKSGKV
jgi:hypothetical protein